MSITPADGLIVPPLVPTEPAFRPTAKSERIVAIDFVRGLALLGILLVNVTFFFGPIGILSDAGLVRQMGDRDQVAFLLVQSACQGKFISLFSLLFGYGLLRQIEKAAAAGRSALGFVARRLGALAVFGALHGVFVWYGDILFIYALLGGWLLLARGVRARNLMIVAVCLLLIAVVLRAGVEVLGIWWEPLVRTPAPALPGDAPRGGEAILAAVFDPARPVWVQAEIEAYRNGPWRDAEVFRLVEWGYNLVATAMISGWHVLGMFFIGGALWRVKFFAPEQAALRGRVLMICLPLGAFIEAAAGDFFWHGLGDRRLWTIASSLQGVSICILPLGYLAWFALLADWLPRWLVAPVSSAGRMALTVYLLESAVATGLSYHWGLGWFGRVVAFDQVLLSVTIWGGLVLFGWVYLRFFEQGPMEKLWRWLEYRPAATGGPDRASLPSAEKWSPPLDDTGVTKSDTNVTRP
jgi:uncharacterized protein